MTNVPAFQGLGHAEGMLKMMAFIEAFNNVLDGTLDATLEMEDAASRLCYIEVNAGPEPRLELIGRQCCAIDLWRWLGDC